MRRAELFDASPTIDRFLQEAPEKLAQSVLGVNLRYREFDRTDSALRIAGYLDREARLIEISTQFKREWQRFTLAHELGHWMLHTEATHFRERAPTSEQSYPRRRDRKEVEADLFAAELLMPPKVLHPEFFARFPFRFDAGSFSFDVVKSLPKALCRGFNPYRLHEMNAFQRASVIAQTPAFHGRFFKPLCEQFDVSPTAMAIQLIDTGLVI